MADETNTATEEGRQNGFVKGLSNAVARKAVVPLAATLSTAGTSYLTRKSSELWNEKVREKGGGRAFAGELVEKAAGKLGGRGSEALSALAQWLRTPSAAQARTRRPAEEPHASSAGANKSDDRRAEERRERRQRRQQRQRALEQSGSS